MKRGVIIESYGGGYIADILFTSNICGFVVQEINKIYKFKKNNFNTEIQKELKDNGYTIEGNNKYSLKYYEIFYISSKNEKINSYNTSRHPDGFVQINCGKETEGSILQYGICEFYPYLNIDNVKYDEKDNMIINDKLKNIFGDHVKIGKVPNANSLPSSFKKPKMDGNSFKMER